MDKKCTNDRVRLAAIDHAAATRHETVGASLFIALLALVGMVIWSAAAGATGKTLPWFALVLGLAVGLTVRLSSTYPSPGVRMLAGMVTLLGSLAGHFLGVCTAQGISPPMVLAHWGPAGQALLDGQVFAGANVSFAVAGAILAYTLPVAGRGKPQHAR